MEIISGSRGDVIEAVMCRCFTTTCCCTIHYTCTTTWNARVALFIGTTSTTVATAYYSQHVWLCRLLLLLSCSDWYKGQSHDAQTITWCTDQDSSKKMMKLKNEASVIYNCKECKQWISTGHYNWVYCLHLKLAWQKRANLVQVRISGNVVAPLLSADASFGVGTRMADPDRLDRRCRSPVRVTGGVGQQPEPTRCRRAPTQRQRGSSWERVHATWGHLMWGKRTNWNADGGKSHLPCQPKRTCDRGRSVMPGIVQRSDSVSCKQPASSLWTETLWLHMSRAFS